MSQYQIIGGNSSGPGLWFTSWGSVSSFGSNLGIGLTPQTQGQMVLNGGSGGFIFANSGTTKASIDGSGNMTPIGSVQLSSDFSQAALSSLQIIADIYGYAGGVFLGPTITLPHTNSYTAFVDSYSSYQSNLFLVMDTNGYPTTPSKWSPLIATDQGFIVKKDIQVGGAFFSSQGAVNLGGGVHISN